MKISPSSSIAQPELANIALYSYYRSSAAYRLRIALALKGIGDNTEDLTHHTINLLDQQQRSPEYLAVNPQGLVPALAVKDTVLVQSLAIIEYLEEIYPSPPILPSNTIDKAHARALAYQIAMDIHPLNNLRVLKYLQAELGVSDIEKRQWLDHWIAEGFTALEQTLSMRYGQTAIEDMRFCFGEQPSIADICLVPQVYNARRFNVAMDAYPFISAIDAHCNTLPAFIAAAPEQQSDAPSVSE